MKALKEDYYYPYKMPADLNIAQLIFRTHMINWF